MNVLSPDTIVQNRYRIVRQIGQGGFGAVYEAVDQRLESRIALKQLLLLGDEVTRAFRREAQLLANLRHPALPNVMDHFTDETGQYLVMQYIPGDDLATLLAQRAAPFPVDEALHWADQLLGALNYLHTRTPPILHRDIKPQNLKLVPPDEIVLLDFGLAKGSAAATPGLTTGYSIMAYTPGFAPLEQIRALGTTPQSDLYALAATLHHLLTNEPPVDAVTRGDEVRRGRPDPLRPVHELNPNVPPAVGAVLVQALALDAEDRPASAMAMRAALQAARSAAPRAEPTVLAPVVPATVAVMESPRAAEPARPLQQERSGGLPPQPAAIVEGGRRRRWLWPVVGALIALALLGGIGVGVAALTRSQTAADSDVVVTATRPVVTSGNGQDGKVASQSGPLDAATLAAAQPAETAAAIPTTTRAVAGSIDQYPITLGAGGEATAGEALYTILSAELDQSDENENEVALRLEIRMTDQSGLSRNFWGDVARLVVDDVSYTPIEAPNVVVDGMSARQGVFVFHFPANAQQAILQVGQIGQETATIPITLDASAAAAPTPTQSDAYGTTQYPITLAAGGEATAGDALYTILSAELDRPDTTKNEVALRLEIRMTDQSGYSRSLSGNVTRLMVDDVPYAPTDAPDEPVEGMSAKQGVFVFRFPADAQQTILQVGQIGEETAPIPIDLRGTQP